MGLLLGKLWGYVSGILAIMVIGLLITTYNYKKEIRELTMDSLVDQLNISSLEDAILKYNAVVESEKIDTEVRTKEFLESQKPEIMIKYINKYIVKRDGNVSECENISDILTNVRYIGL